MASATIAYRHASLSMRFDTVFLPFETMTLVRAMPSIGFVPPNETEIDTALGATIEASGVIGRKLRTSVRLDPNSRTLAVAGAEPSTLVEELNSVEKLINDLFDTELPDIAQFYEFSAGLTAKNTKNAQEGLISSLAEASIFNRLSSVLGVNVVPFGVRLAGAGNNPNSIDWFDIRIEPFIRNPTKGILIEVVYRKPSRRDVVEFAKNTESMVDRLLSTLGSK